MILHGTPLAKAIKQNLKEKILRLPYGPPGLAFLLVGENPASQTYVHAKQRACEEVGIKSTVLALSSKTLLKELLYQIDLLNRDPKIHGILVQLPLPSHLDTRAIVEAIDPKKDVDGFHPINIGRLALGEEDGFIPCTPLGIHTLLQEYRIAVEGKRVVILGRSNIVGKPLSLLLMQKKPHCNATVTLAHSYSEHLPSITKSADILVAAMGSPRLITAEMVSPGTVVIDVGVNRVGTQIVGDVDFEAVSKIAAHITPVPGGIGPMTIAMLLQNTVKSFERT